jgi:hypothetical protein
MITKGLIFTFCLIFAVTLFVPPVALPQKAEPTIIDFRIQAMYRAAKLTWEAKGDVNNEMAVQVLRATTFEDGPYNEVGVVKIAPGKSSYEYIDKSMGSESKYYYKLLIKETNEIFGPLPTRPYFSPPAT